MERQRQQGFPRALRQSLALMLALGFALLAPVSTASAHDVLTGTNPKDGQTLETMPDVIDLGFSNMPLAIGTKILVEDAGGKDWAAGPVKIVDNVVSQAISPDAPGGDYSVLWRVVSSDGHPIEGTFGFTAKSGGPGVSSAQAAEPQPTADRSEGRQRRQLAHSPSARCSGRSRCCWCWRRSFGGRPADVQTRTGPSDLRNRGRNRAPDAGSSGAGTGPTLPTGAAATGPQHERNPRHGQKTEGHGAGFRIGPGEVLRMSGALPNRPQLRGRR